MIPSTDHLHKPPQSQDQDQCKEHPAGGSDVMGIQPVSEWVGEIQLITFFNRTSEVLNAEKDASVFRWFPFKHTFYSQQTAPLLVNQWLSRPFMYYLRPWSLLRYSDWSAASREVKVHEGSVDRFPWSWLVRSIAVLFSALYFHPSFTPRLRTLSWGYMVSVTSTSVSWYT